MRTIFSNNNLSIQLFFQYTVIALAFAAPLSIAAYTALAALLLIFWIIQGDWRRKWEMIWAQPFFKAIGIFYLFLVLSLLWSDNIAQGLEHLRKYYLLLLIPIIYTSFDRTWAPKLFSAFLSAMIISEILSYLIFFDWIPFRLKESWSSIDPSPFMHHTPYSVFLIFAIFIMLIRLFKERKSLGQTLFYSFFIITMTANLFINAGRTGQFSLLIALVVFLSVYSRFSIVKTVLSTAVISTIIFSIAYVTSPNFHKRTNETYKTFDYLLTEGKPLNDSTGWRFMMWQTASVIIAQHPLVGVGVGDEREAYHEVLDSKLSNLKEEIKGFSDFHNTYFQIAVYSGTIGLILFLTVFISLYRNLESNQELRATGAILTTLILLYMFIGHFPAAYLTVLFALITALTLQRKSDVFRNTIVE